MSRERLPLQALPAWMSINDATFSNVEVKPTNSKGNGLVAHKDSTEFGDSPLLSIPHGLVLNAEAVHEYAKEDTNFSQLLHSPRHDILLFLLVQLVHSSRPSERVCLSTPWTEYVRILDDEVPVPTLWKESERILLQGTSLESALNAKMMALAHEFDEMRETSSNLEFWNAAFWDSHLVHLTDWYLVDAWYRSRVLELPKSGPSLVPCIDMANHSNDANAYYEEDSRDEVLLLPRPGSNVKEGDEVTISYGSEKSAAEMLFSYGFIDESSTARSLRLPLDPLPDDPLARAKAHVFKAPPTVEIKEISGQMTWTSAFAYLMILNEEDGLGFRILQDKDGGRELKMFWRDEDVSDKSASFETLISDHELSDVFRLRVNMIVYQRVQDQLDSLSCPLSEDSNGDSEIDGIASSNAANARTLRRIETEILEKAITTLEDQRTELLALESVTAYLNSMGAPEGGEVEGQEDTDDDFS
ncbi:hypothetical protein VMCG_09477 [Cytospora schulzeri]|uniref:SET domain-containing protein n=1 Tax=Cytospora schulzeri TaxID=448051 RepID=A0A423VFX2_9PEZI|nr:hypothetical protein VMCG_09477 [Valsa malicola]